MPSITYDILYSKNKSTILSTKELRDNYLQGFLSGVNISATISDETLQYYIDVATHEISELLNIKFFPQIFSESRPYQRNHSLNFNYLNTTFPINKVVELKGTVNGLGTITLPTEWISTFKCSDDLRRQRRLQLIPLGKGVGMMYGSFISIGTIATLSYGMNLPDFWEIKYITGMSKVPPDIIAAIGKFATIAILPYLASLNKNGVGLSRRSIQVDDLQQSVQMLASSSAHIYTPFVKDYSEKLDKDMKSLKNRYRGMIMTTL